MPVNAALYPADLAPVVPLLSLLDPPPPQAAVVSTSAAATVPATSTLLLPTTCSPIFESSGMGHPADHAMVQRPLGQRAFGSRASRRPSPNRLKASTVMKIITPGMI